MDVAKAPGGNYCNTEASLDQLGWPRPRLEEDELELVSTLGGSFEHPLQHCLGTAESLLPRHRDKYAHRVRFPTLA